MLAERDGPVPVDRGREPGIVVGERIGDDMRRRERDAVERALEFGGKRPRRREAIGLDAPSAFGRLSDRDDIGRTGLFMIVPPQTLIGATSIQRRSFQLCSAHSASCTPLAPSSSVYLYGASSQTWRMNISHCSLKPLS